MRDREEQPFAAGEGETDGAPTEAERREAALLARALEGPAGALEAGEDPAAVAGPLGAARLLQAARKGGLDDLRERAVLLALGATSPAPRRTEPPLHKRYLALAAAACAAAALLLWTGRARPRAALPRPSAQLLQAQLAASRPGAPLGPLQEASAEHRRRLLAALQTCYGSAR